MRCGMKKVFLIMTALLLLTGCGEKKEIIPDNNKEEEKEEEIPAEPVYVDDNPITVGMYMNGKLVTEYSTTFRNDMDIASIDVYYSNESEAGSANTKRNFNKYYANYENIDNYKIGYYIKFRADGKDYEHMILDADNEFTFYPYIYLYLYDDIHQADGSWYSHVTKEEENENTLFTSIKLYLAGSYDKMEDEITVMAFTYDGEDDFDEEGHYRGKSSYTVKIYNK